MMRAADTLEEISGQRPVGLRTPSWDFSPNTLAICREMRLLYDSSLMADDEPYELLEEGEPTGVVELPVEWIRDDAVYFNMDRFSALRPYTAPSDWLRDWAACTKTTPGRQGAWIWWFSLKPEVIGNSFSSYNRNCR